MLLAGLLSLTLPAVDPYVLSQPKSPTLNYTPGVAPSYSQTAWDDPPPLFSSQGSSSSVVGPDGITSVKIPQRPARGKSRKHRGPLRGVISDKEMPICFDFAQGRCDRPNCKYQHNVNAIVRHNSREKRVCFDYLRGECRRGKTCRFSHNLQPLVSQWLVSFTQPARQLHERSTVALKILWFTSSCPLYCDKCSALGLSRPSYSHVLWLIARWVLWWRGAIQDFDWS